VLITSVAVLLVIVAVLSQGAPGHLRLTLR
jgi:hypothetical protein